MKKLIATLLTLSLLLTALTGATIAEGAAPASGADHEITSAEYPLYNGKEDTGKTVTLYFVDGAADLPYIEANDLCSLLITLNRDISELKGYDLTVAIEGERAIYTRENGYPLMIDFGQDIFDFDDFDVFEQFPGDKALMSVGVYGIVNGAGQPSLFRADDEYAFNRYGDRKLINLAKYGIELIAQDGLLLAPLQTVTDILVAPMVLTNLFFNGQCLIVAGEITPDNDVYYAAPTGERSEALTKYGYAELCLMLDCLYGLKANHGIDSFHQFFHEIAYDQPLKGDVVLDADKAIYHFINFFVDDLHTGFTGGFSYLSGLQPDYILPYGDSANRLIDSMKMYTAARNEAYPDGIPHYEEVGNTAYITFDSFVATVQEFETYYDDAARAEMQLEDTIALIIYANEQINRKDSPIENVVIDLSCNVGGAATTAVFTMSWFLGQASISLKDTFTGAMTNLKYTADVNLDREFDERDTVKDKHLFCLTSPVSFSCGNLVPCMFKESGRVTLLGRTSGGGACVVQPVSSAWGTSFKISGPTQISFLKNGAFYDVDRGVDPDFVLTNPAKFYDRQALTDYINSLN